MPIWRRGFFVPVRRVTRIFLYLCAKYFQRETANTMNIRAPR
nr:MAG TPA: hypothetical protein [Caudoviricetes sp.]